MKGVPDVIVVGGGPCGSVSAMHLAKHGADVTVFEEHGQIGLPSHCAGHLSISGLNRLRLLPLPAKIIENTFRGATFHSPGGGTFSVRFSSPVTCSVNRALFDTYIAEMATAAGATYELESRVESLMIKDKFVKGVVVHKKVGTEIVPAKIVVDAEGVSSRLVKQLGLRTLDRCALLNAVEAEVEGVRNVDPDIVEVFLGKEYTPGFYAWLMPKGNGNAKIGLAAKSGNPKELLQRFMFKHRAASDKLRMAKIVQIAFHPLTLGGPIQAAYSNGFLVVGDAASHVKPTTGGGVILGMTCAEIAAQVGVESLRGDDSSAGFLSLYQKRCKQVLGFDMNVMLRTRRMLDAMSDREIGELISLCMTLGLDKTLLNVKDIDFQGKSLLHILGSPRTLSLLGYFFFLYLTANP
jgi:digeranylgeranylglycerophospholipid reductase